MKFLTLSLLFLLAIVSSDAQQTKKNKETIRHFYDAFNKRDFKFFYSCFADSVIVHFSRNETFTITPADIKASIDPQLKAFPDANDILTMVLADEDWVSICVRHTGTNSDSLRNLPPAKKFIDYNVMEMYRLKENKIIEVFVVEDYLSMYQQMGIIPNSIKSVLINKK
jgi:predicted ester cyclase